MSMSKAHKDCLQKNRMKLIQEISDEECVIDGLFAKNVLTSALKEDILQGTPVRHKRLSQLLDLLPRRGPNAFQHFYDVLVEIEEDAAAALLRPALNIQPSAGDPNTPAAPAEARPSIPDDDELPKGDPNTPAAPAEARPSIPDDDELPKDWPDPEVHDPMRIQLNLVAEGTHMKSTFDSSVSKGSKGSIYPMHREVRGLCLIVNNMDFKEARENFVELKDRIGSDKDQLGLDRLFKGLGFDVTIRKDLPANKMMAEITAMAQKDHTSYDCFVCAVLTHGEKGELYGVDGKLVSLVDFTDAVDGHKCASLLDKPKLFFIQACQGYKQNVGVTKTDGNVKEITKALEELKLDVTDEVEGQGATQADSLNKTPFRSDLFVAMSTVEDYVSWLNTVLGSWFIQAVVYVFFKLAHKYDLNQLMTRVHRLVAKAETSKGNYKQVAKCGSSLLKDFYFFPGLHSG